MNRILLIEDDQDDAYLVQRAFNKRGNDFQLQHAWNAEEAKQQYQDDQVDLVLLDINMPGEGGKAFLHHLRKERRSAVPVVMLTTSEADDDVLETFEGGATAYYAKPVLGPELVHLVERILKGKV